MFALARTFDIQRARSPQLRYHIFKANDGATIQVIDGRTTFGDKTSPSTGETSFRAATISCEADFKGATFHHKVSFDEARFQWPKFDGVTFGGDVWFNDAIFSGEMGFTSATFEKSCSFVNTKMNGETSFEGATFETAPPRFFGAKLHEVWPGSNDWPIPKKKDEAEEFVRAYERLKLEMDRLKKHKDELDFFALELQSRRVPLGRWQGLPIALYGLLSDYGRSYVWPFLWLFAVVAFGTAIFRHSVLLRSVKHQASAPRIR